MCEAKFIDKCLLGEALLDDIDDYVQAWHENDIEMTIFDYLGMTQEEYRLWVEEDNMLRYIVKAHRIGIDIHGLLDREFDSAEMMLAARSKNMEKIYEFYQKLKKSGRIP